MIIDFKSNADELVTTHLISDYRVFILIVIWIVLQSLSTACRADDKRGTTISAGEPDADGVVLHQVHSDLEASSTDIRVLMPNLATTDERFPVVYLLPVEAHRELRYGDGLTEILQQKLNVKHRAIFVAPTFANLPWYADHPTDSTVQQETYFLRVVVPFIDQHYPSIAKPEGRLLLGFSKSGWGAWSLLLRHPETFGRAAAWDAPMMMSEMKFGSAPIFGTLENLQNYRIPILLQAHQSELIDKPPRLILTGIGNFHSEHEQIHTLLNELDIPHIDPEQQKRHHHWHSGWVTESLELLLTKPEM